MNKIIIIKWYDHVAHLNEAKDDVAHLNEAKDEGAHLNEAKDEGAPLDEAKDEGDENAFYQEALQKTNSTIWFLKMK